MEKIALSESKQIANRTQHEIAVLPKAEMTAFQNLDATADTVNRELFDAPSDIMRAAIMARGLKMVLNALTPKICEDLCALQGTKLGFRTDRDHDGGYKPTTIRDVIAEALIRGLRVTGNEINVIAGQLYITKEGYQRLCDEVPELSNLRLRIGVPKMVGEGALVPAVASWKFQGIPDKLECTEGEDGDFRIPIRVNKGMGTDAIRGKAESKLLRQVYAIVTRSDLLAGQSEGDALILDAESQAFDENGLPTNRQKGIENGQRDS